MAYDDSPELDDTASFQAPAAQTIPVQAGGGQRGQRPPAYTGLSPLQAGLLYGGAASSVMGPLGILVGIGAGITAGRMRDNAVAAQSRFLSNMAGETAGINNEINNQMPVSDPDQQRMLEHARRVAEDGWNRLQTGDMTGRDMITQSNEVIRSIMAGDEANRTATAQANQAMHRGLITSAANDYRAQYQQNLAVYNSINEQTGKVFDLVNQKGFDPDKPFNKAILAEMLQTGVGGMYRDAPDMLDAIARGAPGLGAIIGSIGGPMGMVGGAGIGSLIEGITTGIKSEKFKVTAEDYNRIAINMKDYATKFAQQKMQQLGTQSTNLDQYARSQGVVSGDYTLGDFVSGGIKELPLTPTPKVPTGTGVIAQPSADNPSVPSDKYVAPINNWLRGVDKWTNEYRKNNPLPLPTN